ncbi:MAG: CRISPR-associated protein Cas4 [Bryobacterales bacterium]|nr:CRISPR-associated protein Cas4 [Bryobacterales bacterium]
MILRVTDLKQWGYCPRVFFYQRRMPGAGKQTYKMGEGKTAQDMIEQLEMRRTLKEYGLEGAVRRFGVWFENEALGLGGKLDLLLEMPAEAAVVEFKLTSGEVMHNHRLQLGGYSLLVEAETGKTVKRGFVYRIPDGRVFAVAIEDELRTEVRRTLEGMREVTRDGVLPEPTPVRNRCEECEYANFCGDVW